MPDLRFAEFLLSLVMPTERAAAVAGDLAESSSGALALMLAVLRTLLGTAFHQVRAEPGTVLRGALYVQVVNMAAGAAVGIAEIVGILVLFSARRILPTTSMIVAADALNGLLVAFFLGRYMLRRYGPNAIAVWAGVMIVRMLLVPGLVLIPVRFLPALPASTGMLEVVVFVLSSLQLLVGIAWEHRGRRKTSRA